MPEEWRESPSFPNYEVSSGGRLRRSRPGGNRAQVGRVLVGGVRGGYRVHSLWRDGRQFTVTRHHLVAEAFLGPRPTGLVIDHLNNDKSDNRPENLEYVTQAENDRRATEDGLRPRGEGVATSKLTEREVLEIIRLAATGMPQRRIAERFGVVQGTVGFIVRRETWAHL